MQCYPFHILTQLSLSRLSASGKNILADSFLKCIQMNEALGKMLVFTTIYPHLDLESIHNEFRMSIYCVYLYKCIYLEKLKENFFL